MLSFLAHIVIELCTLFKAGDTGVPFCFLSTGDTGVASPNYSIVFILLG
jgi:hypothetical protein